MSMDKDLSADLQAQVNVPKAGTAPHPITRFYRWPNIRVLPTTNQPSWLLLPVAVLH